MRLCGICGIERRSFQNLLRDVGHGRSIEHIILRSLDLLFFSWQNEKHTQLVYGSRNLQYTPSSKTSFIFRQRLRNTANMRFRSSIMPASSFALVGFAA